MNLDRSIYKVTSKYIYGSIVTRVYKEKYT